MCNHGRHIELDSDSVLQELFVKLPDWLQREFKKNCWVDGEYAPKYDMLIMTVEDALKWCLSNFCDSRKDNKRAGE